MRPRHKAAENSLLVVVAARIPSLASMRPRHKAAENGLIPAIPLRAKPGFNEAAA